MGSQEIELKTFGKGINVQIMNQQHNNVNGLVIPMNANQVQQGNAT
jgi:hypothetical protein